MKDALLVPITNKVPPNTTASNGVIELGTFHIVVPDGRDSGLIAFTSHVTGIAIT